MRELLSAGCYALFIIAGVFAGSVIAAAITGFINWLVEK